MHVYEKVLAFTSERGVSVSELSHMTGLGEEKLKAILEGRESLYADELRSICIALNVSPELFIVFES